MLAKCNFWTSFRNETGKKIQQRNYERDSRVQGWRIGCWSPCFRIILTLSSNFERVKPHLSASATLGESRSWWRMRRTPSSFSFVCRSIAPADNDRKWFVLSSQQTRQCSDTHHLRGCWRDSKCTWQKRVGDAHRWTTAREFNTASTQLLKAMWMLSHTM